MEIQNTISGNEGPTHARERGGSFGDREPKLFTRVSMSKDGRWFFIDTVVRSFIHVNYMRAIDRNKLAELAQASEPSAPAQAGGEAATNGGESVVGVSENQASKPTRKIKGASKTNDRTT